MMSSSSSPSSSSSSMEAAMPVMTMPRTDGACRRCLWLMLPLLVSALLPLNQALQTVLTFRDPDGNPFQQLAVHRLTGSLYVGATNRLHRLSSGLTLMQSAATGPREDNPACPPPVVPCSEPKSRRDSVTKSLLIDYQHDSLILCSTLYHGSCQKISVTNITQVVQLIHKPLVPNKAMATCVLFIGPGLGSQQALYIGAEYSSLGNKAYRDLVPSISSRQLTNLELSFRDKDGGSKKSTKDDLRASFIVKYVYGFSLGGFAYFMTVQKDNLTSSNLRTRISRVCTQDKYFRSYVEIPLQCDDSLTRFHVLQAAQVDESSRRIYTVFSDTTEASWAAGSGSSVLCVLDMDTVDQEFNRTVQECYAGLGRVGPPHYETTRTCSKTSADVDMCGSSEVSEAYPSLEGQRAVTATVVWSLPSGQLGAAVYCHASDRHQLAYVGTAQGQLFKVVIQGKTGQEVDRLLVDSRGPVVQIQPSTDIDIVYTLSPSKVSMVRTQHCEERLTCDQCVVDTDPICGWCVMQNRCTTKPNCGTSAVTPSWLPAASGSCAKMTNVQPPVVSYETLQSALADKQIRFQLDEVSVRPSQDGLDLSCLFVAGRSEQRTSATLNKDVISCQLPAVQHLPRIPDDHENLVLHFHVQGKSIVTRSVSVFDCRTNTDCSSCTNSSYNCQWCYTSGSCIQQSLNCPSVDRLQDPGITSRGNCPLVWTSARDKDILVHAGQSRQIAMQVRNLQAGQNSQIQCHFSYLGVQISVVGAISSQTLTCTSVKFDYPEKEQLPYVTADFAVTWGPRDLPLDNSQGIQVRIYKCALLVTNCGKCLSMDPEYECGWCGDRCTLQKNCPQGSWLDRTATCPGPQILRFSPTTGPIQGQTTLSVSGLNLGKAYTDIIGGIKVAGMDCEVKPEHFEPSSGFVCETQLTDAAKTGTVVVQVDRQYTAESDSFFSFVEPRVLGIMPRMGPKSGGTTVVIKGSYMDTGSDVSVMFGSGKCDIIKRNRTILECVAPPKQSGSLDDQAQVKVDFGGNEQESPEPFTYLEDPIITMIDPKISILSGGTSITVIGVRLDMIQKPEFFVTYGGQFFTKSCELDLPLAMVCTVPSLQSTVGASGVNLTETSPLEVHYGFTLDGVMTLKNISHDAKFGPLLLFPNPQLDNFPGDERTKRFAANDVLVVNGQFRIIKNLMASVSVMVGNQACENVASTDTTITCEPPSSVPDGTDNTGKAPVLVRIGNLAKVVGYLRYYEVSSPDKPMTLGIILGVVIPILAIIILLTVCVLRRHRKHKPASDYIPDVLQDYQDKKEDEEIGLNHVAVADVNGQILNEEECGPYVADLLCGFDDPLVRQSIMTMMIPRHRLDVGDLIGKGYYGAVYKAQLQRGDEKSVQVAVKTLQAKSTDSEMLHKFLQEMMVLKNLQHHHLLPVVGVCLTSSDDPMVVSPFMATEDLKSYIREPSKKLTVMELLGFGQQIADAMAYLQEVKIVHRNLAARNCILLGGHIRLTDYGLTTSLFPPSHYAADDSPARNLIKWMAPESIENHYFSSKSDVWAFGVVLWELLTRGITPYPDVDNSNLLPYLRKGCRMKKPRQSPEPVYDMMTACWSESPDQRPDFPVLNQQLRLYTAVDSSAPTDATALLNNSVDVGGSTEYIERLG